MSSHFRQSPDSPVVHTGLFLCSNPSHENGRLRGAAHAKVPMKQGGCLQGARAIPASSTGLLWWRSSHSSPTGSICFFSPVQRSVTVSDSSAFCRFHGVIPDATPTTTFPSHMIWLWLLSAASRKAGKEAKYWSHYK